MRARTLETGIRPLSPVGAILVIGLALLGCGPTAHPTEPAGQSPAAPVAEPKTLRIAMTAEREPKGGIVPIQGSLGWREYGHAFHAGLTATDPQDNVLPRLAQKMPSVGDGDWKLLPDGQMEVTWKLRPSARWHDGKPLVADDFAFGMRVMQDAEYPWLR